MSEVSEVENQYPFVNLFDKTDIPSSDFPVDTDEIKTLLGTTQQRLLGAEDLLQNQQDKLKELKKISSATFNKLSQQILQLKEKNAMLQNQLVDSDNDALIYPILIQSIISHKSGITDLADKKKKTLNGVLKWLHQRRNVILYLKDHDKHQEVTKQLEKILFIDESSLLKLIDKLYI
jgi:hypothetical protein